MPKPCVGTVLNEHLKIAKGTDRKSAYGTERDGIIWLHLRHQCQHIGKDPNLLPML